MSRAWCGKHFTGYDSCEGCEDCNAEVRELARKASDEFMLMYEESCNLDADCDSSATRDKRLPEPADYGVAINMDEYSDEPDVDTQPMFSSKHYRGYNLD